MEEIELDLENVIGLEFLRLMVQKYDLKMELHELEHHEDASKTEIAALKQEFDAKINHFCEFFEVDKNKIIDGLNEFSTWQNIRINDISNDN